MSELLTQLYTHAWVVEAPTSRGVLPVMISFGIHNYRFILVVDALWLPWASSRNKIEAMSKQLLILGKEFPTLFAMNKDHVHFGEYLCRHGFVRKIGRLKEVDDMRLYETRDMS